MSRQTTNYGYNISEGSDLVNPLVDIFPNWEALDSDLKDVSDDVVGRATELTTGTVHALTRSDTDRNVFVFTATSNFTAGDTFTLDGTQVSALTPAGEQLSTGCYIIGSDVLVAVHGTLMTMYVSPTKVADSDKLDGHDSTYFATAGDVSDLSDDLDAVSNKVGTGVLTTTAQNCVGAINELNSNLAVTTYSNMESANTSEISFVSGTVKKVGHNYFMRGTFRIASGRSAGPLFKFNDFLAPGENTSQYIQVVRISTGENITNLVFPGSNTSGYNNGYIQSASTLIAADYAFYGSWIE